MVLLTRLDSITPTDLKGKALTNTGATLDTAGKFGNSLYFDATDRVTTPNSADFNFGTGDFTVELWVKPASIGTNCALVDARISDGTTPWVLAYNTSGKPYLYDGATSWTYSGAQAMAANTWSHLGVCRVGGVLYVFLNGNVQSLGAMSTNLTSAGPLTLGNNAGQAAPALAALDDVRITKGVGRYTTSFTPPAAPFPER